MKHASLAFLSLLAMSASWSRVSADWVTLQSGENLRGIDFKEEDGGCRFTLESGEEIRLDRDEIHFVEKGPRKELVEFRGKKVELRKKIRVLQRERPKKIARVVALLDSWRDTAPAHRTVRGELSRVASAERIAALAEALSGNESEAVRCLAARELAADDSGSAWHRRVAIEALTYGAILDPDLGVRQTCRAYVVTLRGRATKSVLRIELASEDRGVRMRAARLSVDVRDRDQTLIAALVDTLSLSWLDQASTSVGDASGSGAPALGLEPRGKDARPRIAAASEELAIRLRAMEALSGRNFGRDVSEWRRWLAENR